MPALSHRTGTLVEYCSSQSAWILIVDQSVTCVFKVSLLKPQLSWKRSSFPSKVSETVHPPIGLKLCLFCGLIMKLLHWIELISIFPWAEGKSKITITVRFVIWEWECVFFSFFESWDVEGLHIFCSECENYLHNVLLEFHGFAMEWSVF